MGSKLFVSTLCGAQETIFGCEGLHTVLKAPGVRDSGTLGRNYVHQGIQENTLCGGNYLGFCIYLRKFRVPRSKPKSLSHTGRSITRILLDDKLLMCGPPVA